jgi:hypothetical protein
MTSGGTESILTAVKASRDYMAAKRGITEPEMVVAVSAHAAFVKAAEYFKIRLIKLPVGADYRLSAAAVRGAIGPNTVLVVASAVGFPHGLMDHVEDIAKVSWAVCLSMDARRGEGGWRLGRRLASGQLPCCQSIFPSLAFLSSQLPFRTKLLPRQCTIFLHLLPPSCGLCCLQVTRRRGIPLHVDCCLGGFVLPFARKLGHRVPSFDFSVPGVTSISTDTHKVGLRRKEEGGSRKEGNKGGLGCSMPVAVMGCGMAGRRSG